MAGYLGGYVSPVPAPLNSGVTITFTPSQSALLDTGLNAGETISGPAQAVCVISGNTLAVAMAGSGLRMPAVGVTFANWISGQPSVQLALGGRLLSTYASGWSGVIGVPLFVGSGGLLVISGQMVSGQNWQRMGVSVSGGMYVQPTPIVTSGPIL